MVQRMYEFGDRVRHLQRPEWGIGSVVRTEVVTINGTQAQRLSVRFPNDGLKTLLTNHAQIELAKDGDGAAGNGEEPRSIAVYDGMRNSGWLAGVADRKITEAMVTLNGPSCDPFQSAQARLAHTLALYRFDKSGKALIEWAVAQSGLDDPLTRFTRQELEVYFERWARQRDTHLGRILDELRGDPAAIEAAVREAPPEARAAVRRVNAAR